jgi:PAS domain S-box-containing protein
MQETDKTHRLVTDITERKQREAEMAWLAQFPGENPNPVLRLDRDGIIRYGNKASGPLLETWGCREGERIPDRWHHIVLETLSSRRVQQAECVWGSRVLALTFAPVGEATCVHLYALDVTDRKRAEEALRLSEEKYKSLVDACPDAVVMTDLDGQILFASRQTWQLLKVEDSEELAGRSVFDCVIPEDRARLAANLARLVAAGMRSGTEYTCLRADGTTVPTETSSMLIRDVAGRPKALIAVIRDISGRKEAEEALRQHHDQLQTIFEGMIEGLVITDIETKRFMRVNASLCRMLGYSEEELLAAIAHLANDCSVTGRLRIVFHSNVKFKRLAAVLENVIYRIVQEGLTNASRHSQSDVVRVTLRRHGSKLRIEIQDWGTGFDLKTAQGRGFGLSGIRERTRLLGGRCRIHSQPGQGTRIVVDLPLAEREADAL